MTQLELSNGPWKVECVKTGEHFSGDNWLIATLGTDHNDCTWYVTTDRVRASEATSEPENDAKAIVEWRNGLLRAGLETKVSRCECNFSDCLSCHPEGEG